MKLTGVVAVVSAAFAVGSILDPGARSSDRHDRFVPNVMTVPFPGATHPCKPVPDEDERCPLLYGPYEVVAEGRFKDRTWQFIWFLSGGDGLCLAVIDPADQQSQYGSSCDLWDGLSIKLNIGMLGNDGQALFAIGPVTPIATRIRLTFKDGRVQFIEPIKVNDALNVFLFGPVVPGEDALPLKAEALRADGSVKATDEPRECSSYRPC